ncbi:hypothetical protein BU25DRAFT_456262 [Macroventuria anomochaeta]|uniref:Uncharacterized protein n=1 Tax=Macroventuria anomochaeta TaxID=301207 RepID=A0ACB6S8E1_9PLEO|nr:uncharacterized protein BU25DRAFT_456262 [Macroventuria anomochaeta]KAF2630540.1 hypothetical protein BU25DRAFT_456262 [Macroventuria anomochaeta]
MDDPNPEEPPPSYQSTPTTPIAAPSALNLRHGSSTQSQQLPRLAVNADIPLSFDCQWRAYFDKSAGSIRTQLSGAHTLLWRTNEAKYSVLKGWVDDVIVKQHPAVKQYDLQAIVYPAGQQARFKKVESFHKVVHPDRSMLVVTELMKKLGYEHPGKEIAVDFELTVVLATPPAPVIPTGSSIQRQSATVGPRIVDLLATEGPRTGVTNHWRYCSPYCRNYQLTCWVDL